VGLCGFSCRYSRLHAGLRFCSNEFIRLFAGKQTTEVVTTMTHPFEKGNFNIEEAAQSLCLLFKF